VPHNQAVGIMQCLWTFTARKAPQGDIGSHSDAIIAEGCFWTGDAQPLLKALVDSGFVDASEQYRYVIHDWSHHCEDYIDRKLHRNGLIYADGRLTRKAAEDGRTSQDVTRHDGTCSDMTEHSASLTRGRARARKTPSPTPSPTPIPTPTAEDLSGGVGGGNGSKPKMHKAETSAEALALRDQWNEQVRKANGLNADDTGAAAIPWIMRRHRDDGLTWEAMRRAVTNYAKQAALDLAGGSPRPIALRNFFGQDFRGEAYLEEDWQPCQPRARPTAKAQREAENVAAAAAIAGTGPALPW